MTMSNIAKQRTSTYYAQSSTTSESKFIAKVHVKNDEKGHLILAAWKQNDKKCDAKYVGFMRATPTVLKLDHKLKTRKNLHTENRWSIKTAAEKYACWIQVWDTLTFLCLFSRSPLALAHILHIALWICYYHTSQLCIQLVSLSSQRCLARACIQNKLFQLVTLFNVAMVWKCAQENLGVMSVASRFLRARTFLNWPTDELKNLRHRIKEE